MFNNLSESYYDEYNRAHTTQINPVYELRPQYISLEEKEKEKDSIFMNVISDDSDSEVMIDNDRKSRIIIGCYMTILIISIISLIIIFRNRK